MWFCVSSLWGCIPILLRITALCLRLVRCYSYLTPLGRFIEVSFNIRCGFLMSGLFLQRCCAVAASAPSSSLLPSFNLHLFLAGGRTMGERWKNDGRTSEGWAGLLLLKSGGEWNERLFGNVLLYSGISNYFPVVAQSKHRYWFYEIL